MLQAPSFYFLLRRTDQRIAAKNRQNTKTDGLETCGNITSHDDADTRKNGCQTTPEGFCPKQT